MLKENEGRVLPTVQKSEAGCGNGKGDPKAGKEEESVAEATPQTEEKERKEERREVVKEKSKNYFIEEGEKETGEKMWRGEREEKEKG